MTDREKVIKGLEHELQNRGKCGHYCRDGRETVSCEYDKDGLCIQHWGKDALALLKAQEPMVLALEEIHRGMAVWLEDVDKADVILAIGGSSAGGAKCFITEKDMSITPKDAEYGIRWRAWTQKPTDKQREKVKWE